MRCNILYNKKNKTSGFKKIQIAKMVVWIFNYVNITKLKPASLCCFADSIY